MLYSFDKCTLLFYSFSLSLSHNFQPQTLPMEIFWHEVRICYRILVEWFFWTFFLLTFCFYLYLSELQKQTFVILFLLLFRRIERKRDKWTKSGLWKWACIIGPKNEWGQERERMRHNHALKRTDDKTNVLMAC